MKKTWLALGTGKSIEDEVKSIGRHSIPATEIVLLSPALKFVVVDPS